MNIVDFTTNIVNGLVHNPDMVRVSSFDSDEEATIIEILVSKEDMGSVIGKEGRNAKALRTIIQAYAYLNDIKRVKINIDAF